MLLSSRSLSLGLRIRSKKSTSAGGNGCFRRGGLRTVSSAHAHTSLNKNLRWAHEYLLSKIIQV